MMHVHRELVEDVFRWKDVTFFFHHSELKRRVLFHGIYFLHREETGIHFLVKRIQVDYPDSLLLVNVHIHFNYPSSNDPRPTILNGKHRLDLAINETLKKRSQFALLLFEKGIIYTRILL